MRNIDHIHYQGRCDRAHCAKQYNHSHPPLGELRAEAGDAQAALEEAKRASDILAERSEALSQRMELAKRNAGAADMRSRLFLEIAQTYRLAAAPEDMDRYAKEAAAAKEAHEAAALERTRLEELVDALEQRLAEAAHESYAAAQRVEKLLMIARSSRA